MASSVVISPDPAARERKTAFHRYDDGRKIEPRAKRSAKEEMESNETTLRDKVSTASKRLMQVEGVYSCPDCGNLSSDETPLLDETGGARCPRMFCDLKVQLT